MDDRQGRQDIVLEERGSPCHHCRRKTGSEGYEIDSTVSRCCIECLETKQNGHLRKYVEESNVQGI